MTLLVRPMPDSHMPLEKALSDLGHRMGSRSTSTTETAVFVGIGRSDMDCLDVERTEDDWRCSNGYMAVG